MATPNEESRGPGRGGCSECGANLSADQRYCVACGTRRGSLPAAVAGLIAPLAARDRGLAAGAVPPPEPPEAGAPATPGPAAAEVAEPADVAPAAAAGAFAFMPSPRAAAIAVMGMLAFGVVIGSATSQLAQSAGLTSIILEASPPPAKEEPVEYAAAEEVRSSRTRSGGSGGHAECRSGAAE